MFLKGNKDKYFNTATTLIFAIIVIKDNCYYFSGFYLGKDILKYFRKSLRILDSSGRHRLMFYNTVITDYK